MTRDTLSPSSTTDETNGTTKPTVAVEPRKERSHTDPPKANPPSMIAGSMHIGVIKPPKYKKQANFTPSFQSRLGKSDPDHVGAKIYPGKRRQSLNVSGYHGRSRPSITIGMSGTPMGSMREIIARSLNQTGPSLTPSLSGSFVGSLGGIIKPEYLQEEEESEEDLNLKILKEENEDGTDVTVDNTRKNIDSGYAWVILAVAFTLNVFMSGQFGTLGIYLVEFLHYFDTKKAPISYIGACQMFVGYFMGVFNGAMMKRYGLRAVTAVSSIMVLTGHVVSAFYGAKSLWVLYIFFGVISGVGFLNFYLVAIIAVQQYFDKKRAFATGICTSGLSLGIFFWSPFTRFLIDKYSWQGSLLIQSGIFANGLVCAALLRPPPPRIIKPKPKKENSETEVVRKKCAISCSSFLPFFLFLVGYFCIQLGHMTLYTYTPLKCAGIGIEKTRASFLISLMGITGIFARPVLGLIGDCRWANRTVMIGISALMVGVITVISTTVTQYVLLAVFSATFGFFSSGYMALYGAALVDIVGLDNIEVTSGTLMCSKGAANLMLHMMSGWLMDVTNNVNVPFMIFGAMQAIGGILIIPIPWIKERLDKKRTEQNQIEQQLMT